ncbi:MAG: ATP-binding protein [Bacteroidota bacterium]
MLALTPASVPLLCQTILAGLTAAYLLALRSRTPSTRWLACAMVGQTLYAGAFLLSSALPIPSAPGLYAVLGLYLAIAVTIAALVQFAYTFLADPFPRERRRALVVSGLILAVLAGQSLWIVAGPSSEAVNRLFVVYGLVLLAGIVWAGAVHGRQYRRFQRAEGRGFWPPTHDAQGHLAFGFLTDIFGAIGLANFLVTVDLIGLRTFQYVALLCGLAVSLGYVVMFVNHAREPTMVQGKLVGLALATVLAFLGLAGVRLFNPTDLAREAGNALPATQTVRVVPLEGGGYKASTVTSPRPTSSASTSSPDTTLAGPTPRAFPAMRALTGRDFAEGVALPFAFPLFGRTYTTVYPSSYGAVRFDAPVNWDLPSRDSEGPLVAALLAPTGPYGTGTRATVALDADAATFTWQNAYEFSRGEVVTLRATLRADGSVDLRYDGLPVAPTFGQRGLWPGTATAATPVRLGGEAVLVEPDQGLIDDFAARYRPYAHAEVAPLARIVFFAALFVLGVMPFFFRASLLNPLAQLLSGVQRLERGDREARVAIRSSDEIGALATGFNRMADAVADADRQLKAHAETLEQRVAERTASLQEALDRQQAMQTQLVQSEKLASLGRLTAGIAHEIKNPLNFVTNFAALSQDFVDDLRDLLQRDPATLTDEDRAEIADLLADLGTNVAKIEEHGQRADGIIRGMLAHARGGEGERRTVEVNALAEEFLGLAYHGMRARRTDFQVRLDQDFDPDAGVIEAVPQDLGRVLLNLLNNAFEALYFYAQPSSGDSVSPSAPADFHPAVRLTTRRLGDRVTITVADNGPGVPAEAQARLFEPFFTTKPTGQGTGLGLSISHDIVRSHGGTLAYEPTVDHGATFVLALPLEPAAPLAAP